MRTVTLLSLLIPGLLLADLDERIDTLAKQFEDKTISFRHDIHQHPELSNKEFRTAAKVAEHLRSLGMEVQTEVAVTGVVGLLKGDRSGPVVALRADMDALPVTERTGLPYASKVRTQYEGKEVGVMHACGHDAHVAILMGTAEVLANLRSELPGSVKFIFQPAEEGAWPAPVWGAQQMIQEGVLQNPSVDAIFGLHVQPGMTGSLFVRSGPLMASSDFLRITVTGRQTHAATPWRGVDPITVASQIVLGLQTIASRQVNILGTPSVVSIGTFHAGDRNNIIPNEVVMTGTIRTFDEDVRSAYHKRVVQTAQKIAASAGAQAEVYIGADTGYSVTINHEALTEAMTPTLRRIAGKGRLFRSTLITGSEDFSFFQKEVPGLFFFLGVTPPDQDPRTASPNHSPLFMVHDGALLTGVRALSHLAVEFMIKGHSQISNAQGPDRL